MGCAMLTYEIMGLYIQQSNKTSHLYLVYIYFRRFAILIFVCFKVHNTNCSDAREACQIDLQRLYTCYSLLKDLIVVVTRAHPMCYIVYMDRDVSELN